MDKIVLRTIIENHLACLKGDAFQDTCDRLCLKLYPNDYTSVRAGGPKGDTKNDGYCPKVKIYFAAHATRGEKIAATKKKIETDLKGCVENYSDVKTWIYLTNDTLVGEIQQFVNEQLRTRHSKLVIETWDHKKITEKILTLEKNDITIVTELNIGVTVHLEAEIENAARLLTDDKPQEAWALLNRLWEQHGHDMNGHQKYRTLANIGHAYEQFDKRQKAAEYFLEAKQHDRENEKARAREVLAYLYLGSTKKAYRLAECFLEDFPENGLGRAVLVLSTPNEMEFDEVEKLVPEHQRNSPEVATSLGEAAMYRGHYDIAEKYTAQALKEKPDNPRIKEKLGTMLLCRARITEQAVNDRGSTKEEAKCLQQAKSLFTEAFNDYQKQNLTTSMVRMLLQRANVYMGLNEYVMMDEDILFAYKLLPSDSEVVFRYASIKVKSEDWDGAISLLETLIDKGLRCSTELFLSQCLDKRGLDGDKKRALELLRSRINDLDKEMPELRTEYLATLVDLERQTQGIEAAIRTLGTLPENIANDELVMVLRGEAYRLNGDQPQAVSEAKKLFEKIAPGTSVQDKRRIATFLQAVGMYKEALKLWETIVQPEYIGRDTYRLMQCADQCKDIKLIIEFNEKLRANGLWERKLFELEIYYREKYNDWRGCKQVLQDYIENPLNEVFVPYARAHLSHVAGILGETDLIETDLSRLPSPWDVNPGMGQIIVQALRLAGEPESAVEFAYELVRRHWNSLEAHITMGSFIIPIGPKPVEVKLPEAISEGTAVRYKENRKEGEVWHIIEDSQLGDPDAARKEYSVDHIYSQRMLGLKKGDTFQLREGGIQERRGIITEILLKFDYRIRDCMENFEDRFPDNNALVKINAYQKDGVIDLEPMRRMAEKGEKRGGELIKLYRKQPVPIYFLATKMGKDLPSTLRHLITEDGLEVRCREGSTIEMETAAKALEDVEEIVVDEMTLTTLLFCGVGENLMKIPQRLVVSEGTLLNMKNWEIMSVDPNNPGGSLGMVNGQLTLHTRTKEEVEEAQGMARELIEFIEKRCSVESGLILSSLESSKRELLIEILGQACVESMALASTGRRVLWTDDFFTGSLLSIELGGRRIWTQFMFEYLAHKGLIDIALVRDLTLKLVSYSYWFTSLNTETAIEAITKSDWDVDSPPLKEVLAHIGEGRVNADANLLRMIGALLKHIWIKDPLGLKASVVTIRILNELAKREHSLNLIRALWICVERLFGVDVVTAKKVEDVFENWLKGGGGPLIIT